MKTTRALLIAAIIAAPTACSPPETILAMPAPEPLDTAVLSEAPGDGPTDAGPTDGGPNDGGPNDAGPNDAGPSEPARFSAEPFPTEKSKAPTREEWKKAPLVSADRNTMLKRCSLRRLREWVRIECDGYYHSISMVSGDHAEVDVGLFHENNVYLVLPIRRGQKRLFQVNAISKWSWFPSFYISEHWLSSEDTPFISILDA